MAFNKEKGQQFDEFFGQSRRQSPARESYNSNEDVFSREDSFTRDERMRVRDQGAGRSYALQETQRQAPPSGGRRGQAVRERFNAHTSSRPVYQPEPQPTDSRSSGRFRPHSGSERTASPAAADDSWASLGQSEDRGKTGYDQYGFEPPRSRKPKGKTVLLTVLGILIGAACIALTVFFLRPADGGEYYARFGALPQVTGLTQTGASNSSIRLDWEPVDDVAGYRIYRVNRLGGSDALVKTVYLSQTTIRGLGQGTSAEYMICPFCTTADGEYVERDAATVTAKTLPGKAGSLTHDDATASSVTLEWMAADGADGYEVERHTGSWFKYEKCGDTADTQTTISGLEASTEYTFRMRPYIDIGGERCYGKWSDKFTTGSSPEAVYDLAQGQTTDSGYVLNWAVDSAVTGFELYRADPETGAATELLSQCGNNYYEIYGLESVNYSSYCVRAFLRHSGGISYGEFSPVITAVTLPVRVASVDQYTSAGGAYTISWQPSERAAGYEIYAYSCHRGEYYLLTTVTEPSYTIAGLAEYAERYKVRAYAALGELKFFGEYSDELPCYPYYYLKRTVRVDVESTNLHTYSGPEYELITTLSRGTTARVFGERSGSDGSRWFRVELENGTTGWLSREDVAITNTCGTLATREYTDENPIIIYLSPSKQDKNFFWANQTTEKEQMEAVGAVTHRILEEEYNCVVYTATPELELRERAFEALELKADVYLAIHSNATGTGDVHYGASSYYCGASGRSKNLGQTINAKLNAIAPMECTLYKQMYSALESFGGVGYAEVRDPYNLGMVALLAETDFHDNELTGQWIIDNHEAIGRAYVEALAEAFDIDKK